MASNRADVVSERATMRWMTFQVQATKPAQRSFLAPFMSAYERRIRRARVGRELFSHGAVAL